MHEFEIRTMTCGGCANRVKLAIRALDAHAEIEVDLRTKKVSVRTVEDRAAVARALADAGYSPTE